MDGPEFDAHRVDFTVLVQRNSMYRAAEQQSMELFQQECQAQKQAQVAGQENDLAVTGGKK